MKVRTILLGAALSAVALWVASRWDVPSIGQQTVWQGAEGKIAYTRPFIIDPRLAYWVIPSITMLMSTRCEKRVITWFGIGTVTLILVLWVLLRRPAQVLMFNYYWTWPDYHIRWILSRTLNVGNSCIYEIPPRPPIWLRFSVYQAVDLSCLLGLLVLLAIRLYRRGLRTAVPFVALLISFNIYPLVEMLNNLGSGERWGLTCPRSSGLVGTRIVQITAGELVQCIILVSAIVHLFYLLGRVRNTENRCHSVR